MSESIKKSGLVKLENKIDKRFDDLTALMSNFANQISDKFYDVDKRFDNLEERFDKRIDGLTNIIDGYAGKIDTYAQEMAAMDHKINRLERYIQILADNAGIDLDKIHA
ncbi:MAG: hypothetical protein WCH58_02540 [Candidatus Saccharibacteria bacterium]